MTDWKLSPVPKSTYELIRNGTKTIEVRSPDPEDPTKHYGEMKPGDTVHFFSMSDGTSFSRHIRAVRKYRTAEEVVRNEDLAKLYPGTMDEKQWINLIQSFPNYPERIRKYGLVAIEVQL